jgi:hypothetical protein
MNRLQTELQRLYGPPDPPGGVRAMVLAIEQPADWDRLGAVWRGVQQDLDLPAPAVAIAGGDGLQLWFSLADPVPGAQAHRFLDGLRRRYLADVPADRLRLLPAPGAATAAWPGPTAPPGPPGLPPLPGQQVQAGRWSAFVAPDLAPMFATEQWLEMQPGIDGQSELLCRLHSMPASRFSAACQQLAPVADDLPVEVPTAAPDSAPDSHAAAQTDPWRFLMAVMNDPTVDLPLRVDAAKALLSHQPALPEAACREKASATKSTNARTRATS